MQTIEWKLEHHTKDFAALAINQSLSFTHTAKVSVQNLNKMVNYFEDL
jgi:hypothetical protein